MNIKNISQKERGYLFGLLEGDGYKVYDKKSRHYQIEFYLNSVRDIKIIDFLVRLLKKIELNPNLYQDKRYDCKRIRVYSKEFFNLINKNISIKEFNKDFKIGFVSGIIDSEGHVNNKKHFIMVINTNKKMLDECKHFLASIKINSNISLRKPSLKDKKPNYRMYISVKFKSLPHLSIKAGYTYA